MRSLPADLIAHTSLRYREPGAKFLLPTLHNRKALVFVDLGLAYILQKNLDRRFCCQDIVFHRIQRFENTVDRRCFTRSRWTA
jgi:hypothetical protein